MDVGKAITEALQRDRETDILMWSHEIQWRGPGEHPPYQCWRCGMYSWHHVADIMNRWMPRWCRRRNRREVRR
jgi:hypothetical protein